MHTQIKSICCQIVCFVIQYFHEIILTSHNIITAKDTKHLHWPIYNFKYLTLIKEMVHWFCCIGARNSIRLQTVKRKKNSLCLIFAIFFVCDNSLCKQFPNSVYYKLLNNNGTFRDSYGYSLFITKALHIRYVLSWLCSDLEQRITSM